MRGTTTNPLFNMRLCLWLASRVVNVLRLSNLILVTLSSLKPLFFNGLKKAWPFSDNVGAEDPGIQEERRVFMDIHSHEERARL
jgi:hypothetical protein